MNNLINARVCTSLHGNWPVDEFKSIADEIFHREIQNEFGTEVWIPKSSIVEASDKVKQTEIWKQLNAAFEANPFFDEITLGNC